MNRLKQRILCAVKQGGVDSLFVRVRMTEEGLRTGPHVCAVGSREALGFDFESKVCSYSLQVCKMVFPGGPAVQQT